LKVFGKKVGKKIRLSARYANARDRNGVETSRNNRQWIDDERAGVLFHGVAAWFHRHI